MNTAVLPFSCCATPYKGLYFFSLFYQLHLCPTCSHTWSSRGVGVVCVVCAFVVCVFFFLLPSRFHRRIQVLQEVKRQRPETRRPRKKEGKKEISQTKYTLVDLWTSLVSALGRTQSPGSFSQKPDNDVDSHSNTD